jgi:SAM-dependent methyltransferase
MQQRHTDRKRYFDEQGAVTSKYIFPYIEKFLEISPKLVVAEIGCGEAGNMAPFLEKGCTVYGIDLAANKIANGKNFYQSHPLRENLHLIANDIYLLKPEDIEPFDFVYMRDTIEHIPDQERFFAHLKQFLKPGAKLFFGFPSWRMPFGGHQQLCNNKLLSILPYFHLLPNSFYKVVLTLFGESKETIQCLQEIRETRISIRRFRKIVNSTGYTITDETFYLINPNYEIKFNLKLRALPRWMNIPFFRDFFTTTCYYILENKE